jgi:hypothetical protein
MLVAVKRVLHRKDADFKHFYHVKQMTVEEYQDARDETTKEELGKLFSSKEYN